MTLGIPDDELPMQQREAEESQRMNEQEMNVAIAEVLGAYRANNDWHHPNGARVTLSDPLPNYTRDLNAMHEAEKVLRLSRFWDYADELNKIVSGELGKDSYISATAMERAEAFLRTIGKFTPTPTPEKTSKP